MYQRLNLSVGTVAIVAIIIFTGCAGIDYQDVTVNKDVPGIRYYRPATYILVVPDYDKSAAKVSLWHGPDTSRVYAADPYSWFASNKTLIEFTGGMLSKVSSEADSTKLPETLITAATEISKATLDQLAKQTQVAAALARAGAAALLRPQTAAEPLPIPIFLFVANEQGIVQIFPEKEKQ